MSRKTAGPPRGAGGPPFVTMVVTWWPPIADSLTKPWPKEAACQDLRWHADQWRMGRLEKKPGRRLFAERWGWTTHQARKLLDDDEWQDQFHQDFAPEAPALHPVNTRCREEPRALSGNSRPPPAQQPPKSHPRPAHLARANSRARRHKNTRTQDHPLPLTPTPPPGSTSGHPFLDRLRLRPRECHALRRAGITSPEKAAGMSLAALARVKSVRAEAAYEVRLALLADGLLMWPEELNDESEEARALRHRLRQEHFSAVKRVLDDQGVGAELPKPPDGLSNDDAREAEELAEQGHLEHLAQRRRAP